MWGAGAYPFIQCLPLVIRMVLSEIFEIVAARLSLRLIRLWRKIRAGMKNNCIKW